ncbi:MAG: putative Ig domain-containing protein, partial [Planctomycetales bacterium]|nr:putative Ig domain-containing protein [Planctomycetales bacterium]
GADNVFGFDPATQTDGGLDDNFHLAKSSPAIDRGNANAAPALDLAGQARVDDPGSPNLGPADYQEQPIVASLFDSPHGGVAQGWQSDNDAWTLNLPFDFPLFGNDYSSVEVSTEGFLHFAGSGWTGDDFNDAESLGDNVRIAPLWDDLFTYGDGNDIYVDDSTVGEVTIVWDATVAATGGPALFGITLYDDGRFDFHYGAGNAGLTPTIGVGRGDGTATLSSYDGRAELNRAASHEFTFAPTFADIGAYEFLGSTLDDTPPTVVSATAVTTPQGPAIHVLFSEAVDPIDANAPANYELREAGPNGLLGDADDVSLGVDPEYQAGDLLVVLHVTTPGVSLEAGRYELVVHADSTIHDLAGLRLDGDGDGQAGGNFIAANQTPSIAPPDAVSVDEGTEIAVHLAANDPDDDTLTYSLGPGAPAGAAIDSATGMFRWTPTESQAPGVYHIAVRATDNGSPALTATTTLTITANEVNDPP